MLLDIYFCVHSTRNIKIKLFLNLHCFNDLNTKNKQVMFVCVFQL